MKHLRKQSKKIGMSPGSLVYLGEKKIDKVGLDVIDYDLQNMKHKKLQTVQEVLPFKKLPTITWFNIIGLHDMQIFKDIEKIYDIHGLVLEDILNIDQRPKFENFDNYIFIVLKMIHFDDEKEEIVYENLSLILGKNHVLTFQERKGDIFNPVRERIKNTSSRLRKNGADYLTYALIDVVVDNYFLVLEKLAEKIEFIEENVLENPDHSLVQQIQKIKKELLFLRKSVWPLREVINSMSREDSTLIGDFTSPFLRDLYDHIIQVIDTIETYREMISGLLDIFLSSLSNRMNEVMKVLTIIATIFIPLTFLAGIYGMNFEFMPELKWRWAYPSFWIIILTLFTTLLIVFKRRKWL